MTYQDSLILPPLSEGNNIADNQLRYRHQTSSTNTRDGSESDQLRGGPRKRRRKRADEEDGQSDKQDDLARPNIRKAPVEELEARGSDEIAAGKPRGLAVGVEGVSDDAQACRQRGLVHQGQQVHAGACEEDCDYFPDGYIIGLLVEDVVFLAGCSVACHRGRFTGRVAC